MLFFGDLRPGGNSNDQIPNPKQTSISNLLKWWMPDLKGELWSFLGFGA
jgi:hypothetical protein